MVFGIWTSSQVICLVNGTEYRVLGRSLLQRRRRWEANPAIKKSKNQAI